MEFAKDVHLARMQRDIFRAVTVEQRAFNPTVAGESPAIPKPRSNMKGFEGSSQG